MTSWFTFLSAEIPNSSKKAETRKANLSRLAAREVFQMHDQETDQHITDEDDVDMECVPTDETLKKSSLFQSLEKESKIITTKPNKRNSKCVDNMPPSKKSTSINHPSKNITPTGESLLNTPSIKDVITFGKHDVGPFKVCLKAPKGDKEIQKPSRTVDASRRLLKSGISFTSIEKSGFNRWMITFANKSAANDAIKNSFLKQTHWDIFIPHAIVFRQIVIKEIPIDISEDDIMAEFKNSNINIPVKDIYRLKRRVTDSITKEVTFLDSESVKFTIRSSKVPQFVFLWKIRFPTSIFIPKLRVCYSCGSLNHPTKFCREVPRCLNCSDPRHSEDTKCQKPAICVCCGGNHRTFSKDCQMYSKRLEINRIMAQDNVDFRTARLTQEDSTKTSISDGVHRQVPALSAFPPLRHPSTSTLSHCSAQPLPRNSALSYSATTKIPPSFTEKLTLKEDQDLWDNIERALTSSDNISLLLKRLLKAITLHESATRANPKNG